jgi:hypothetical protein
MPKSEDEREDPVEPSAAKIPEYLVERLAPRSRDQVVIFGGHLLQLIGAIAVIYVILHSFLNIGEPLLHDFAA